MVTIQVVGALQSALPSGEAATMPKTSGITVTAMSISTVPVTVGVTSRLKNESFAASRNWTNEDTTTSVASRLGTLPPPAPSRTLR